jgi:small subunit ribosomal protein S16
VAANEQKPRDGAFLEIIGSYDPSIKPPHIEINKDRFDYWISVGAQPTEAVEKLLTVKVE